MAERNLKPSKITSMNENYKGENFFFAQECTFIRQSATATWSSTNFSINHRKILQSSAVKSVVEKIEESQTFMSGQLSNRLAYDNIEVLGFSEK